jgi:hypothetical protein
MKTYGGMEFKLHHTLPRYYAGEWTASHPDNFIPGESPPYPLDGRLGNLQTRPVWCGVENNFLSVQEIEPRLSSP